MGLYCLMVKLNVMINRFLWPPFSSVSLYHCHGNQQPDPTLGGNVASISLFLSIIWRKTPEDKALPSPLTACLFLSQSESIRVASGPCSILSLQTLALSRDCSENLIQSVLARSWNRLIQYHPLIGRIHEWDK